MFWNINIPNCVPEMFREEFEREAHEAQLRWERKEHYEANRTKLQEAYKSGLPVLHYGGYDACLQCNDADYDTQTCCEGDLDRVICHNPDCPEHGRHKEDE